MKKKSIERLPRIGDLWKMTHVLDNGSTDLYIVTGYTRCKHAAADHTLDCIVQLVFLSDLEDSITYTVSEMFTNDVLVCGNDEEGA